MTDSPYNFNQLTINKYVNITYSLEYTIMDKVIIYIHICVIISISTFSNCLNQFSDFVGKTDRNNYLKNKITMANFHQHDTSHLNENIMKN